MKFKTIFIAIFILFAVFSCEKENAVFNDNSSLAPTSLQSLKSIPSISGPSCALPNKFENFTLTTNGITNIVWSVDGNATIVGGQGTANVTVAFNSFWNGGSISLNGKFNGRNYFNRLDIGRCIVEDPCADLQVSISNGFVDGTSGGTDEIFLDADGNFPPGTTYAWLIFRENGNKNPYNASTENPRRLVASFANKVVRAEVTARFGNCTKTAIKIFNTPIPDTENPFGGSDNGF